MKTLHHMKILFENADLNNRSYNMQFCDTQIFFMQKKLLLLNALWYLKNYQNITDLLRCKVRPCTIRRNGLVKNMQSVQQWHNFDVVSRLGAIMGNHFKKESTLFCDMRKSREWTLFYVNKMSEFKIWMYMIMI